MSCDMKKDVPKSSIVLPIVIVAVLLPVLASALIVTCILAVRRRRSHENVVLTQGQTTGGSKLKNIVVDSYPRTFTYKELSKATKSFSAKELLGRGGFGSVYRGVLPTPGGTVVAVKQIAQESHQGEREFLAEVTIISKIRHRNLVQLLGWCNEKSNLLLVYDYMPNGSLDKALHEDDMADNIDMNILSWTCRYNIITGVAAALSYLHGDWDHCILHRDIKPSNVLLDSDMNARLADFGLARLVGHNKDALTTMMAGTFGYMAPELPHTGKVTMQSDVYSFGILALEVVSGRKPLHIEEHSKVQMVILLDTVWAAQERNNLSSIVDQRLGDDYDSKQATLILEVALLCCHPDPVARPSMKTVSQVLSGIIRLPMLPTSQPMVTYSLRPKQSVLDTGLSNSSNNLTSSSGYATSSGM